MPERSATASERIAIMVDSRTLHRSLATAGSVLVAFVGLSHEVIGARLFPWGPSAFGGALGWHAAGLAGIVAGLLLLVGTLHVAELPVFILALCVALVGAAIATYTAVVHGQFHLFAVVLALSGLIVGVSHRTAESLEDRAA